MEDNQIGAHRSEPVLASADRFEGWLSVPEAVVRCEQRSLSRTAKTIRKWAARSYEQPSEADVSVRREDTENGYRWVIEINSLDRKIDEELEFEARKSKEHVRTTVDTSAQVSTSENGERLTEPSASSSEPVRTTSHNAEKDDESSLDLLRAQLEHTQEEIAFLRDELKHRRKTDAALGQVIETVRIQAGVNNQSFFESKSSRIETPTKPVPDHDLNFDRNS